MKKIQTFSSKHKNILSSGVSSGVYNLNFFNTITIAIKTTSIKTFYFSAVKLAHSKLI